MNRIRQIIDNPDAVNDPPRPFFEHVVALRSCIVNAALAWAVCCIIAGVFSPQILDWIKSPAAALEAAGRLRIEGIDLLSGFNALVAVAGWGGTAFAFPFLVFFLLRFIFPALTNREKTVILGYLLIGTLSFAGGVGFAYARITPRAVAFFDWMNEWMHVPVSVVRVEGYISTVLKLVIAFGLVFQLPLILFLLGWLGVISSDQLRGARRFAIVIAFVLGMVLTPPDPMSQILMAVPLCILYELCIWAVWLKEKASRK